MELESPSRPQGLIPVQPKDELTVGYDALTAAGNYSAPNRFNGNITTNRGAPAKLSAIEIRFRSLVREGHVLRRTNSIKPCHLFVDRPA